MFEALVEWADSHGLNMVFFVVVVFFFFFFFFFLNSSKQAVALEYTFCLN